MAQLGKIGLEKTRSKSKPTTLSSKPAKMDRFPAPKAAKTVDDHGLGANDGVVYLGGS